MSTAILPDDSVVVRMPTQTVHVDATHKAIHLRTASVHNELGGTILASYPLSVAEHVRVYPAPGGFAMSLYLFGGGLVELGIASSREMAELTTEAISKLAGCLVTFLDQAPEDPSEAPGIKTDGRGIEAPGPDLLDSRIQFSADETISDSTPNYPELPLNSASDFAEEEPTRPIDLGQAIGPSKVVREISGDEPEWALAELAAMKPSSSVVVSQDFDEDEVDTDAQAPAQQAIDPPTIEALAPPNPQPEHDTLDGPPPASVDDEAEKEKATTMPDSPTPIPALKAASPLFQGLLEASHVLAARSALLPTGVPIDTLPQMEHPTTMAAPEELEAMLEGGAQPPPTYSAFADVRSEDLTNGNEAEPTLIPGINELEG